MEVAHAAVRIDPSLAIARVRPALRSVRVLGGDLAVAGGIGSSAALNARADGDTLGAGAHGPPVIKPLTGGTDCQLDDVAFIGFFAR